MKIKGLLRAAAASLVAVGVALGSGSGNTSLVAADYTRYHTYEELTAALRELTKSHANLARLVEVAKTRDGRTVWAIEIGNPSGTPLAQRPALLIAANLEGDQVIGSELALFVAEALLTGYAGTPAIKARLDANVFYILPRVNPDAAELMFAALKTGRKTNTSTFDNDNDGRVDEDGPEDLNKDGVISMMRVKDPLGPYMISPDDPRLMRRADAQKGERGGYAIYWEGTDDDGDGFYNEDPAGGIDINRNFQHQYPYFQPDAGPHMASEAETRGVLEYVLERRNIAAVLTFGESDNLIAPPTRAGAHAPASPLDLVAFANQSVAGARDVGRFQAPVAFGGRGGRGFGGGDDDDGPGGAGRGGRGAGGGRGGPTPPATTVNVADVEYFRAVSDKYRQLTGLRSAPATRIPGGALFEYAYYQFGVPAFSTPGWGIPEAAAGGRGGPGAGAGEGRGGGAGGGRGAGPAGDAAGGAPEATGTAAFDLRLLRWMDAEEIDGFTAWQPFKHPTLGDVEIGGFKPYATSNPPAARIAELGKSHAEFATYLASIFPQVSIASTSVTAFGGGLYRIKAEIENGGYLPTATAQGVRARSVKPTMVQLGVDPADIVSGAAKTSFFPTLAGSSRRQTYEWIVKGKPGSTIALKAVSQKGGTASTMLTLK